MAKEHELSKIQIKHIDALVAFYRDDLALRSKLEGFDDSLVSLVSKTPALRSLTHSYRSRPKTVVSLRRKLIKKFESYSTDGKLNITPSTLGLRINDLIGLRILHLHTNQIEQIDAVLKAALADYSFEIREGPIARTWDDELRRYYRRVRIQTVASKNMYTSVHYVVNLNNQKQDLTAEIQVRTLAEELWGEVDHQLNYPEDHESAACQEQIKVLARLTSAATRLVDSIFLSDELSRQ